MINISSIKAHMFCPMSLYIQTFNDSEKSNEYQLAIEIKKLKIDIQDLIQKNMRKVKKEMSIAEIESELSENIDSFIKSNTNAIISMDLPIDPEQINERRPVVMDVNLRKGLFEVIREIKEIIENKKLPNVKINPKKCNKCQYENYCIK